MEVSVLLLLCGLWGLIRLPGLVESTLTRWAILSARPPFLIETICNLMFLKGWSDLMTHLPAYQVRDE